MQNINFYPTVPKMEFTPYKSVEFQNGNNLQGTVVGMNVQNGQNKTTGNGFNPNITKYPVVQVQSPRQTFAVPQNIALSYRNKNQSQNSSFVYGVIGAVVTTVVLASRILLCNTNLRQKLSSWYKKTWEVKNSYHPNIVLDNHKDIKEYREVVLKNLANDKRYKNDLKCIDIFTGNKEPQEVKNILNDVYEIAKTISYSNYKTPKVTILLKQDAGILNLSNVDSSLDELDVDIIKNGVLGKIKQIKFGFVPKDNDYTAYTKATTSKNKNETNYSLNIARAIRRFLGGFSD